NGDAERQYRWYIANLLPRELQFAQHGNRLPVSSSCDLLVLMLGFTLEPLLQVIATYKPKKVLMVLNKQYDVDINTRESGEVYFERTFRGAFDLLNNGPAVLALTQRPQILPDPMKTAGDTPVAVFRFLRDDL